MSLLSVMTLSLMNGRKLGSLPLDRRRRRGGEGVGHFGERDAVERAEHDPVDLHPIALHDAGVLDAAVAGGCATVGDADGALEGVDDGGHRDGVGFPAEREAAAHAAMGLEEAVLREPLEDLAHRGQGQLRLLRQVARALHRVLLVAREEGEQHDPVVGQPRHPDHRFLRKSTNLVRYQDSKAPPAGQEARVWIPAGPSGMMAPMDQVLTEAQVSKVYELTDGLLLNRDWAVVPLIGMVDGMEMLM